MARYDGLREALRRQAGSSLTWSFDQVVATVPGGLPDSAFQYAAWWSNETEGRHVQARGWLNAGWRVETVNLGSRRVTFRRIGGTSLTR